MRKILLLPLFTMESGHHRTADALMESLRKLDSSIQCEKVDFLSYVNSTFEKSLSEAYLKWITKWPSVYSKFYMRFFNRKSAILEFTYETLFLEKMERMIQEKQPDLIICTHSFPSFLVNKLKEYRICNVPVVNIYTDFCVNHLWGKKHVDLHFVPSQNTKEQLINNAVPKENIIISGILTNNHFLKRKKRKPNDWKMHVLVAGGSLGLGELSSLRGSSNSKLVEYRVLCGSNFSLYKTIASLHSDAVRPYSYVTSPAQMNQLYDWADALITKPGGVTVSEGLTKKLPIFIHSVLPGQEERNMNFLEPRGLVQRLNDDRPIEEQIISVLHHPAAIGKIKRAMQYYANELEVHSCMEAAGYMYDRLINHADQMRIHYIDQVFSSLYQGG